MSRKLCSFIFHMVRIGVLDPRKKKRIGVLDPLRSVLFQPLGQYMGIYVRCRKLPFMEVSVSVSVSVSVGELAGLTSLLMASYFYAWEVGFALFMSHPHENQSSRQTAKKIFPILLDVMSSSCLSLIKYRTYQSSCN